jgi:hypothetical protein
MRDCHPKRWIDAAGRKADAALDYDNDYDNDNDNDNDNERAGDRLVVGLSCEARSGPTCLNY